MTVQPVLDFDAPEPVPYQRHSETSRRAAVAYRPKLRGHKRLVFDYLRAHPDGLTDNELIHHFYERLKCMSYNTPRARRIDLTHAGLVVDSGAERAGCAIWRVRADLTAEELRTWIGDDQQ